MQVKRFKAADMRRALELVRSDLGEDAVILSSNNTKKGVEILATADDCQELLDSANAPAPCDKDKVNIFDRYEEESEREGLVMLEQPDAEAADLNSQDLGDELVNRARSGEKSYLAEQLEKLTANITFPARAASTAPANERVKKPEPIKGSIEIVEDSDFSQALQLAQRSLPAIAKEEAVAEQPVAAVSPTGKAEDEQSQQQIDQLQTELSDMRELLEMQLAQSRFGSLRGLPLACDRRLEQMGFGLHFRSDFHAACDLANLPDQDSAWAATRDYLIEQVPTLDCDLVNSGGQLAFVGATGAGKTTTIAKLAARYVLEHGPESIALVTMDNVRLGSQDQLKSIAKILQIPLRSVSDAQSLPETLASLDYCRLVLIDTPGVSSGAVGNDPFVQKILAMPDVTKLAVLAANVQRRFQQNLLAALSDKHLRAVVLTKLDETDCLAETLDVTVSARLPVAYTAAGQHIPNDLSLADAEALVWQAEQAIKKPVANAPMGTSAGDYEKQSA